MPCVPAARLTLLLLLALLAAPGSASAAADAVWSQTTPGLSRGPQLIAPAPSQSASFALRADTLRPRLKAAPGERNRAARSALPTVSIPVPDGSLQRFRVVESPVMEPGLAAKVPEFTSYAAIGIDDPTATARLDLSPLGFHATVRSASGSWFVDPSSRLDDTQHIAYRGTRREDAGLQEPIEVPGLAREPERAGRPAPGGLVPQRVYRLALASDPTYADEFGPAGVNAAKATLVNRANQIYNDDLAIKMILVTNNDRLNFSTTASFLGAGYVTAACANPTTLPANQNAIDSTIGPTEYDFGHLISASDGGGLAASPSVGRDGVKAQGCTGVPDPRGDGFAVDYFAHEVGHQFGGNHTFNGTSGDCSGANRNASTSVEPGSGSSIMAYASICGADNLQNNSDPYFSQRSLTEIQTYVASNQEAGATNGGTLVATGNRAPVVTAPPAKTIPARTPFTLTGGATDPDGNSLIYLWEQNDTASGAGTPLQSNTKPSGALFRQFGTAAVEDPTLSPAPGQNLTSAADSTRTFPDLEQIAGGNTNAASGSCPTGGTTATQVECFSEFLPTNARALNFRLTARDSCGGESSADTRLIVADSAPFRVSAPAAPQTVQGGTDVAIAWDVGGTRADPIGTADVRIRYSIDGGLSFPTVLVDRTPNDGAQTVRVPNLVTSRGRFRVEAVDNYFFDVSHADLTVTADPGSDPDPSPDPEPPAQVGRPCPAPPAAPGTADAAPSAPAAAAPATAPAAPAPAPSGPIRQPPIVVPPTLTGDASKFPAKIRVLRAGVKGKRLDVLAEITRRASGRVRVAYRSGGVTERFTAKIAGGRIRFKHKLSGANARKTTGIFTLTYAGDEDVRADKLRLRAANRRAGLRRGATEINAGRLEVSGTISKRARGVVRIRLEYLDGSELVLGTYRARIRNGRWALEERLPAAAAVAGGQLSIQFTGYEAARMRGEQSAKQVAPG